MTPELIVLIAGVVIGIALVAIGAIRVLRLLRTVRERIEGYRDLPLLRLYETTNDRVERARQRAADFTEELERAQHAAQELAAASARLRDAALSGLAVLRVFPALFARKRVQ